MSRRLLLTALVALALYPAALVAQSTADVTFKDDIKRHVIKGDDDEDFDVSVTLTADTLVVTPKKGDALSVPYKAITSITYDRRSKVRKMAYTMSPAKKHFLTIQFKAGEIGDFAELEMGKGVAPRLVAMLEARSGVKIDRSSSGN
jgi:hypothetical protein